MRQVRNAAFAVAALAATAGAAATTAGAADRASIGRDELAALSGGSADHQTQISALQALDAINTNNQVIGTTVDSGAITIHQGAFEGFSGIGNFVLNSGHNNNLQGSINVTIVVPETPQ